MTEQHDHRSVRAFLTGVCIGAGLALLYAPQTGARLRRTIRSTASRVGGDVRDAWETAQEEGRDYLESGKAMFKEAGAAVESAVELGRDIVETARSAMKDASRELKQHLT